MKKFEEIIEELRNLKSNYVFVLEQDYKKPFSDEQIEKIEEIHFNNVHLKNTTIASLYQMILSSEGQRELTERLMGWGIGAGDYEESHTDVPGSFRDLLEKAKTGTAKDRGVLLLRLQQETYPPFIKTFEAYLNALITTKDVIAADELLDVLHKENLIEERHSPKETYIMRDALWVLDTDGVKDINRYNYIKKSETEKAPTK